MKRPVIAITMGDPAGIGPEICLKALNDPRVLKACIPVVIGNAQVLEAVAARLAVPFTAEKVHPDDLHGVVTPAGPTVADLHALSLDDVVPGQVSAACGHAAYEYIAYAIDRTMAGVFDAITTAPISKEGLHAAGIHFPGHTEILAEQMGAASVVMMLTSPRLTVSLVTTHVALRQVPGAIKLHRVAQTIRLTQEAMARLLGRAPRLAVLGLNCHAGEAGLFGAEEARVIAPAIAAVQSEGIDAAGPLPPDTAFTKAALARYDAHVCMYHDQGLIPFKTLSFADGVNVTLGIPIVRTSVDHGTAFDIAWQGIASPESLIAAVRLAVKLAKTKK